MNRIILIGIAFGLIVAVSDQTQCYARPRSDDSKVRAVIARLKNGVNFRSTFRVRQPPAPVHSATLAAYGMTGVNSQPVVSRVPGKSPFMVPGRPRIKVAPQLKWAARNAIKLIGAAALIYTSGGSVHSVGGVAAAADAAAASNEIHTDISSKNLTQRRDAFLKVLGHGWVVAAPFVMSTPQAIAGFIGIAAVRKALGKTIQRTNKLMPAIQPAFVTAS